MENTRVRAQLCRRPGLRARDRCRASAPSNKALPGTRIGLAATDRTSRRRIGSREEFGNRRRQVVLVAQVTFDEADSNGSRGCVPGPENGALSVRKVGENGTVARLCEFRIAQVCHELAAVGTRRGIVGDPSGSRLWIVHPPRLLRSSPGAPVLLTSISVRRLRRRALPPGWSMPCGSGYLDLRSEIGGNPR
jgi:hypothetical protein